MLPVRAPVPPARQTIAPREINDVGAPGPHDRRAIFLKFADAAFHGFWCGTTSTAPGRKEIRQNDKKNRTPGRGRAASGKTDIRLLPRRHQTPGNRGRVGPCNAGQDPPHKVSLKFPPFGRLWQIMTEPTSISNWLAQAKAGDELAVQQLWEHYFPKLVELARRRLNQGARRVADEEDIALSAFATFCLAARTGRYDQLRDRDGLWRLLTTMTANESNDHLRYLRRLKRGGGEVRGESAFAGRADESTAGGINDVAGDEFPPELQAELIDSIEAKLNLLTDEERAVALKRMNGFGNAEIAQDLGRALRTVELRVNLIRKKWDEGSTHETGDTES